MMLLLDRENQVREGSSASRALLVYEILSLGFLFFLAAWAIRPLLEEWALFRAFNTHGIKYFGATFDSAPLRPLHILPYYLQWLTAKGTPIGVGILCGLLMVIRYLVVRWAVSPLLSNQYRATFALFCAACVGWPALWLGRFSSAQISSILFFAIIGFSIRLIHRKHIGYMLCSVICLLLMLMIYQAPLLVVALLPLWAFFGRWITSPYGRIERFLLVGSPLIISLLIYVGYFAVVRFKFGTGYEGNMLSPQFSAQYAWGNISNSYRSVFVSLPYIAPLFFLLIIGFISKASLIANYETRRLVPFFLAVLLLPILSLIYVYPLHTNDPERMLFPAFLGLSLIILVMLQGQRHSEASSKVLLLAVPILAWATICAAEVRAYWDLQSYVVRTTTDIAASKNIKNVTIIDNTGLLGDIYTLYDIALSEALHSRDINVTAAICTPVDVDRIHPIARRYPLPTTTRCGTDAGQAAIIAEMVGGSLRLRSRE